MDQVFGWHCHCTTVEGISDSCFKFCGMIHSTMKLISIQTGHTRMMNFDICYFCAPIGLNLGFLTAIWLWVLSYAEHHVLLIIIFSMICMCSFISCDCPTFPCMLIHLRIESKCVSLLIACVISCSLCAEYKNSPNDCLGYLARLSAW